VCIKSNTIKQYWDILHERIFRCLLLKLLHWTKISIRIPSKIFLHQVNEFIRWKLLRTDWNCLMSWDAFFMLVRRLLKTLIPKQKGPFWNVFKFTVGICKSELSLVMLLWISEFYLYKSQFLPMNNKREKVYCDFNGRVFSFLNNWQQEFLFLAFIITLIILFGILKILEL